MKDYAIKILNEIGINAGEEVIGRQYVSNQVSTDEVDVYGTKVHAQVTRYDNGGCRVEVYFNLPENACMAETYIQHCVKKEGIPVGGWNHRPYAGRKTSGPSEKHTEVYSPWNNRYFCVDSMYYGAGEFDEAVENAITLARPLVKHLVDVPSLRYWKTDDEEVKSKAREIIVNADFADRDVDREYGAHWMVDENSFFKGWFYPFNDRGRGTFDTLWPSSVDYAASNMGIEGSFEYAVASVLLQDEEFIRKARKACRIIEETVTRRY